MSEFIRNGDDDKYQHKSQFDLELEQELQAALGNGSVFDLLDQEQKTSPSQANTRKGTIIAIHGEDIFVDFGGKSQGLLSARAFDDKPMPNVGETIDVVVRSYDAQEGLMILAIPGAVQDADWDSVAVGQRVEARVTGHNKGGLEVQINGIRGFMPISQIEIFRVDDLQPYVGQKFICEITECDRSNRNLLVSRRPILDEQAAIAKEKALTELAEGKTVHGVVRSIMPYGAFVDLGGVDGLLHIKDMSHKHVAKAEDIVKIGQGLEVMVLKIDRENRKIALGLKQVMPDPWAGIETRYTPKATITGRVSRFADFGAFVEIEEGVEGLVPIGEITFERRLNHPSDVLNVGQIVTVRILDIDPERKRVSLSIKQAGEDPWTGASVRWAPNSIVAGKVTRTTDFGAFVELTPGVEGLVHVSEVSTTRIRAASDVLKPGDAVNAKVLSVDEEQRRIALSIKQVAAAHAEAAAIAAADAAEAAAASGSSAKPKKKKQLRGGY
jgi:small subunit ribosomal protein S1